ncbi:MAG: hypothetical protein F6J94_06955 [Moorea sp. SIO1F2]|uniref:PKD domain-containing protein n=1 Tax=Moorena sp. SIO1F2 TaxID=2607819 RepID=UPI0013B6308F|nr:PKD domain-containing protein [Moorena sp. SIO1F2]NET81702.1 hypothetical protein [Moorena sp. SIO1F2]
MNRFRNWLGGVFAFLMASGIIGTVTGWIPNFINWITNEEPNVSWTVSPLQGDAPLKVIADTNASDPDGDTLKISWYVDDDLQTEGSNTSHEFNLKTPGQYRLRALVTDGRVIKAVERITIATVNRPVIPLESMELDRPFSLEAPEKLVELPTKIITNGYSLSLTAYKFSGAVTTIRAFKEEKALNGKNGGNARPGTNGQNGGQNPGEMGQNGSNGTNGAIGKDSGLIYIKAEVIDVPLTITNNAQHGGNGGIGGNGGDGGKGGKGKSSKDGIGIGGVGDCKRGPGRGGKGGVGGDGGKGGDAGAGGKAGGVTIEASEAKRLEIEALGGKAGQPGAGGTKGKGGNGGDEGNVTKYCRTKDRYGARGADGTAGIKGATAKNGVNGQISVRIGSKTYKRENGSLSYP